MKLDTILLGLNGHRAIWNNGGIQNQPCLGVSTDIQPFIRALGWLPVEANIWGKLLARHQFGRTNIQFELSNVLDMGPVHRLFYIAAHTPEVNINYEPRQSDKEKLLEMAKLAGFQDDPLFGYLINTYNLVYSSRGQRILKKDLPGDFEYREYGTTRLLITRYMLQQHITEDTICSVVTMYNMVYKDTETFKKIITGKYETGANEAPCDILQYSTKVERYIKTDLDPKKVFFGIELELEGHKPERLVAAHELLKKHCIFKRDGSINNGMEIVSKPASVEEHKQAFKPFFDARLGYTADSNCGIHIHASRGNMSFLQLGRIYAFLNNNKQSIVKIAGRESNYARFKQDDTVLGPWYNVSGDKYAKHKKFTWDKYTAVNLAPSDTMEFRIFKSTTDWNEFCRFLEFPDALISYCSLAGNDNKGKIRTLKDLLSFSNFADFVAARGKAYPTLNKFIQAECV